jgi:hypothetical protein
MLHFVMTFAHQIKFLLMLIVCPAHRMRLLLKGSRLLTSVTQDVLRASLGMELVVMRVVQASIQHHILAV